MPALPVQARYTNSGSALTRRTQFAPKTNYSYAEAYNLNIKVEILPATWSALPRFSSKKNNAGADPAGQAPALFSNLRSSGIANQQIGELTLSGPNRRRLRH